jgi:zinc protease
MTGLMKRLLLGAALAALPAMATGAAAQQRPTAATAAAAPAKLAIDMRYLTLPNGLRVVLSRDTLAPTVTVGVYYGIGFRVEPRDRTGFAHLFEHLMFQGSQNAPKGVFISTISNAGGVLNGSTRFDFTNYFEIAPSNALERILWLEADRMARPVIDDTVLKNQQGVVGNEVKVNVLNQPYSTWPWIDLPMLANTNWYNSHNFYGDLKEIEAATVTDAKQFHSAFYRPNNAVLVVAGDIDYAQAEAMVRKHFGPLQKGAPVTLPDLSEPRQTAEKVRSRVDALAPKPGWAAGYHMPPRGTPEWYAMGLIDQMLVQGDDSRLVRKLKSETGITGDLSGGINAYLGNMYNYNGPMLWAFNFTHDPKFSDAQIRQAVDGVIDGLRTTPVTQAELDRARTKLRSDLYSSVDGGMRIGLIDLLAVYALFDNDPQAVNRIESGFAKVTPALIQKTAVEYLRPTNRSIYTIRPGTAAAQGAK